MNNLPANFCPICIKEKDNCVCGLQKSLNNKQDKIKDTGGYCVGCLKPLDKCQCMEEELADALKRVRIIRLKDEENE